MRYLMRQKVFCLGNDFVIKDEAGVDRFLVDGRAFTIGQKLAFQDMVGRELAYIRQKLLAWGPTYEVYRQGQLSAVVKKELFTFFKCRFTVDVPGPDDLLVEGDLLDHEYSFNRNGQAVAHVSKRWFSFSDTYGVDVLDGQDDVLILASSVVIDLACHNGKSGSGFHAGFGGS